MSRPTHTTGGVPIEYWDDEPDNEPEPRRKARFSCGDKTCGAPDCALCGDGNYNEEVIDDE